MGNILIMKKILLIFLIIPFAMSFYFRQVDESFLSMDGIDKVYVVTKDKTEEFNALQTAQYNYVLFDEGLNTNKIKPEGFVLYMTKELDELKSDLNLLIDRQEVINDMQIYYGYTPLYNDFVISNNKRINTQIVARGDKLIVGFPMILSGF